MEENATGIVLRLYPYSESSLIVHWLTPDAGRIHTLARGARRPKSPFRGKLDLYHLAEFTFRRSRRSDLHTLREVRVNKVLEAMRQDWRRLQWAAYGAALIETATERDTPLPETYPLYVSWLHQVALEPLAPSLFLAFEIALLNQLGLAPSAERLPLRETDRHVWQALGQAIHRAGSRPRLSVGAASSIYGYLRRLLAEQLGRIPPQRDAAWECVTEDPLPRPPSDARSSGILPTT